LYRKVKAASLITVEKDRTIAKFLRSAVKQKARVDSARLEKQTAALAERIRDRDLADEVGSITKRAIEMMQPGYGPNNEFAAVTLLKELTEKGCPCSAEVIYVGALRHLRDINPRQLVSLAPTAKALTALCKQLPVAKELLDELLNRPAENWLHTAAADWLFKHAKIAKLESAFIAALSLDKRPPALKNPAELLQSAEERDKKGLLLFAVINNTRDPSSHARFARTILAKPKIAKIYLSVIRLARNRKKIADGLTNLLRALVSASLMDEREPELRRTASLFFIGLISDVMMTHPDDKPVPPSAMNALQALAELETAAATDQAKRNTWTLLTLDRPESSKTDSKIDLNAARILKIAFEQTDCGANAVEILEAMAFNLGLRPIGETNSVSSYDPRLHEDTIGGLHPGDRIKIMRKGWSLNQSPIIRAKVIQQIS
jgi:hypothetical protein